MYENIIQYKNYKLFIKLNPKKNIIIKISTENKHYETLLDNILDITNDDNVKMSFTIFYNLFNHSSTKNNINILENGNNISINVVHKIMVGYEIEYKILVREIKENRYTITNKNQVDIRTCKDFERVCYCKLNNTNTKELWKPIFYDNMTKIKKRDPRGRTYIITVNNKIFKIGLSNDKAGIGRLTGYHIGNSGSPSIRTLGIHYMVAHELTIGNKVEFYVKWATKIKTKISGLLSEKWTFVTTGNPLEKYCIEEYKIITGEYPTWNKQELGGSHNWSITIKNIRNSICSGTFIPKNEDENDLLKLYHMKWTKKNVKISRGKKNKRKLIS